MTDKQEQLVTPDEKISYSWLEEIHHTDLGNTLYLTLLHGSKIRYCYPKNKWYVWDGTRWKPDDTGRIYSLAKNTVHKMYHRAQSGSGGIEKNAARHAIASEARRAIDAMVELARSESGIPILPAELDADPWLLNLENGTLNLETGKLGKYKKKDLITKLAPVKYDAEAKCPLWDKFLERVLGGNWELIEYLRRAVGYTLTGDTSEHVLFFLYGTGANGKTTFLHTLQTILGDYSCQADPDLLLSTSSSQHPTNIARLEKVRLTVCMEVGEGRAMKTSLMKQLTGGDKRTARRMRQDFREYEPTDKIWLGANNKPRVRGQELAIWRRIKLIPFTVTIPEGDQDKHLAGKLIAEGSGILNWALVGCERWQFESGLDEPGEVKSATADYKSESDPLNEFVEDYCNVDPNVDTAIVDLYESYLAWASTEGLSQRETLSRDGFSRRLGNRFQKKASVKVATVDGTKKYQRGYIGIGLKTLEERETGKKREHDQLKIPF